MSELQLGWLPFWFKFSSLVKGVDGKVMIDQIQCIDKEMIGKKIRDLTPQGNEQGCRETTENFTFIRSN